MTINGVGTVTVRAMQAGDSNYNAATSVDRTFNVTQPNVAISVTSSLNPAEYGQAVTFTASVASSAGGKPTGTVQFKDNSASVPSSPEAIAIAESDR